MKLEPNMYVKMIDGTICKYVDSYISEVDETEWLILNKHIVKGSISLISKASYKLGDLLRVGDFLDNHCIVKIENTTIFLNDGWFIDFDDLEDLVTTVCTKEQFERVSYEVGE